MGTVTNPFAARGSGRRSSPETPSVALEPFLARLSALGATDAEVAGVRANWDVMDEDWTHERRLAFATATDADLVAIIDANRGEHRLQTNTDEELAEANARRQYEALLSELATDARNGNVTQVLAWVGGDVDRAAAMLALEYADGAPRSTLIAPLEALIGAAAATGPSATALTGHVTPAVANVPEATHEPFDPSFVEHG